MSTPTDRNKIAQELSVEDLSAFVAELAALPGKERTLRAIAAAAERRGIRISLESAKSFRNTTFKRHLERIERRREFAERFAGGRDNRLGATIADAAADNLAETVFDLTDEIAEATESGEFDLKKMSTTAFIIKTLRQGDVARDALHERVKIREAVQIDAAKVVLQKTRELKTIADDKSIDEGEKVARIRRHLFGEDPTAATAGASA